MHVPQISPFPWQGVCQCSLKLVIQPWICAPGSHYDWVDRGSVEYEVHPTLLHMGSTENLTRPSDLEFSALFTWPCAPTVMFLFHYFDIVRVNISLTDCMNKWSLMRKRMYFQIYILSFTESKQYQYVLGLRKQLSWMVDYKTLQ